MSEVIEDIINDILSNELKQAACHHAINLHGVFVRACEGADNKDNTSFFQGIGGVG